MDTQLFRKHSIRPMITAWMTALLFGVLVVGSLLFAHSGEIQAQPPGDEVDRLIADLKSPDTSVQTKAAQRLAEIGDVRSLEPLLSLVETTRDKGVQFYGWKALEAIKDPRAVEPLLKHLQRGSRAAAAMLRRFPEPRVVDALLAAMRARDPTRAADYWSDETQLRVAAIRSLGAFKDARVIEALVAAFEEDLVRGDVCGALKDVGDRRIIPPMLKILQQHADRNARISAIFVLEVFRDPSVISALEAAASNDADQHVREAAARALEELKRMPVQPDSRNGPVRGDRVGSNPPDGATNVDPATREITVAFPSDMRTDSYSVVVVEGGTVPEAVGSDPYTFRGARTFVMSVKLAPNTAYAFGLNSDRRQGFKTADGTPLPPTVIRFRTGTGQPIPPPQPGLLDNLVVTQDAREPGEFKSIAEAIKQARSGAKITIYPGTYAENVILDRPVTLKRELGESGRVVIESTEGSCILMKTDRAELKGLTLRNLGGTKGGEYFGVEVQQGELVNGTDGVPPPVNRNGGNEKEIIALIERLGGMVELADDLPGKPVVVVDFRIVGAVPQEVLLRLKDLPQLKVIRLGGTGIGDEALNPIGKLTGLVALDLHGSRITDAGLAQLRDLNGLAELDLEDTAIGDTGLAHLKGMTRMRTMILSGTRVSDAGLVHLREMANMRHLALNGTRVTDVGLASLKGMAFMEELHLVGTEMTDAGLDHLQGMVRLRILDMSFTKIGNEGLKRIKEFKDLEKLVLVETRITDAGLVHLHGLKQLKFLDIDMNAVTPTGVEELKRALPQTEIIYSPTSGSDSIRPISFRTVGVTRPGTGLQPTDEATVEQLMTAARDGDIGTTRALLAKGVPVDVRDKHGATALMYATVNGHARLVLLLLDAGAKLNTRDDLGWTPLHWATSANVEMVKLLLDRGADVNAKDSIGYTPLMNAAHLALPETAELLLERGADLKATTRDGRTAMDMALRSSKGPRVVPVLEKWAGRSSNPPMPRRGQPGPISLPR